ncbi:MAG: UDP-N-acetylglucosamine 2-epimerase (non-hydrolyzing) [Acidimicrobiia bacterium]|nr:UDP-N-acetylglucosamine 2-epimerase (non-hydrolyzing) [Acidimicrobiia bacterium]NNF65813.1 UDP-N-acetylglucosamine 2-epimerase (non-hydrolyzing) [Acidimicrobiia bacterium]
MNVLTVVGARPQFIKAAAVSGPLRRVANEILVHTGQHYDSDMSAVFFDELGIPEPDIHLEVGSASHGAQTGRMLEALEGVIVDHRPDVVMVYGDTNSTLAGALAAAKLNIPVAHVEAGLRSDRHDMPEEVNRVLTDHVSEWLFCPTSNAVDRLALEGITDGVHLVGDVMADSVEMIRGRLSVDRVHALGLQKPYAAATIHRAENTDDANTLRAILELLAGLPLTVAIPIHPRTAAAMTRHEFEWPPNVTVLEPAGYIDMLSLVANAEVLVTDSGGLQKESAMVGTRCITVRNETEWPETVASGWNTVVGTDAAAAVAALDSPVPASPPAGFGPGAAERIVELLAGA